MSDTIERIALRFTSGNGVPVERAYITADEWKELRRDAERYRWLRDLPLGSKHEEIGNMPGYMWDAAIDAAMGEREGAK